MLPVYLTTLLVAAPALVSANYPPVRGACPTTNLTRPASAGINPGEAAYVSQRYAIASQNLATWLAKVDPTFPTLSAGQYPTLALVSGGGGLRGWTISAGVHKAFDSEEPDAANYATSGLYQSLTYETGLSGSAIMLYSYVQNNWPLTSTLLSSLWVKAFAAGLTKPPGGAATDFVIGGQVSAKGAQFFETSLTDTWGRLLSYGSFLGANPGVNALVSNFVTLGGYTSAQRPYPIVTALGVENVVDGCGLPPQNATQYEFTPHEFGSWEARVANFMQVKYIGTSMNNGVSSGRTCVTGWDNAGWIAATSSNTFNQKCGGTKNGINGFFGSSAATAAFRNFFVGYVGNSQQGNFALLPNPFQNLKSAAAVSSESSLHLVDGGESIQVPGIWPLLYRPEIDTIIVSDNSADSPANYQPNPNNSILINFPSGQQIYHTYQQSIKEGISSRMPYIPPPSVFQANNFNKNPMTFFGCTLNPNSPAMFIVYLPNRDVVFDSNIRATITQYDANTTAGMIANGEAIATNNGDPDFAGCMACGLMKRSVEKVKGVLPQRCHACFVKYCSNGY